MLIDAHAHLDKYCGEVRDAALQQIREEQVFTVAAAMDIPSYRSCVEIGDACELVLPTFGIHPRRAPEYAHRLRELGPLIEQSPAIGEIGLDFHWVKDSSQFPAQRKVLQYFLAAAREQKKMVNLHTKGGEKEVLDRLRRIEGQVAGIRRMYEDGRYCIDVLDQISAARAGLEAAALVILEDHVNGCVRDAIEGGEGQAKAQELVAAVRRYVRSV